MKIKTLAVAAVLSVIGIATAQAEEAKSPHSFSANVTAVSDYVFRGITQTDSHPAIQGGFDYAHASGLYAGLWASNVDFNDGGVTNTIF